MTFAAISRSEASPPPPPLQRLDGEARVVLRGRGLVDLYQRAPCRIMRPRSAAGRPEIVFVNTAGGITDGDILRHTAVAEDGARAVITSQAAEKVYRSRGGPARVENRIAATGGARLDWLPQETILFDGAALRRTTLVTVAAGARLLALDWLLLGRLASGEQVRDAALRERWRVRLDGRLVWADDFRLDGDAAALADRAALLGGARAIATLILVADDAQGRLEAAREALCGCTGRAAASAWPGLLLCRFLAADGAALRADVAAFLIAFRAAPLPRIWSC